MKDKNNKFWKKFWDIMKDKNVKPLVEAAIGAIGAALTAIAVAIFRNKASDGENPAPAAA